MSCRDPRVCDGDQCVTMTERQTVQMQFRVVGVLSGCTGLACANVIAHVKQSGRSPVAMLSLPRAHGLTWTPQPCVRLLRGHSGGTFISLFFALQITRPHRPKHKFDVDARIHRPLDQLCLLMASPKMFLFRICADSAGRGAPDSVFAPGLPEIVDQLLAPL